MGGVLVTDADMLLDIVGEAGAGYHFYGKCAIKLLFPYFIIELMPASRTAILINIMIAGNIGIEGVKCLARYQCRKTHLHLQCVCF